MKTKTLWLIWLYLFALCCVLGFIPEPPEFVIALLVMLGAGFFVPGGILLKKGGKKTVRTIRLLSICSLLLTLVTVILNYVPFLTTPVWNMIFHILLGILSTPMFCCQIWVSSLFGWACLLSASLFINK
jgi:hypothetical protein